MTGTKRQRSDDAEELAVKRHSDAEFRDICPPRAKGSRPKRCKDPTCRSCYYASFASFDRRRVRCWLVEKNGGVKPRDCALNEHDPKRWFKCGAPECGHEFDSTLRNVVNGGNWCPYCANQKRCDDPACLMCTRHSFAGYDAAKVRCWMLDKNGGVKPRDCTLNESKEKRWFRCDAPGCGHEFDVALHTVVNMGNWCPYCANRKRCDDPACAMCTHHSFASYEASKVLCWMLHKNGGVKPRDSALNENKPKRWFRCDAPECGHEFDVALNTVVNMGSWCPLCKKKTERKLLLHLRGIHVAVTTQHKLLSMGKRRAFDFYRAALDLIYELDGAQHFRQVSNWTSHTETRQRDVDKTLYAIDSGHRLVRLLQEDVCRDRGEWKARLAAAESWVQAVSGPCVVLLDRAENPVYQEYITEMMQLRPAVRVYRVLMDGSVVAQQPRCPSVCSTDEESEPERS
jgi:very-short-patch-repair endonuclease